LGLTSQPKRCAFPSSLHQPKPPMLAKCGAYTVAKVIPVGETIHPTSGRPASGSNPLSRTRDTTMVSTSLAGCSILICEDEALIALDISKRLLKFGRARSDGAFACRCANCRRRGGSVGRHPGSRAKRWREFAAPPMPKGAEHPVRGPQWIPRRA
jgi:hypothetical protein